MTAKQYTMEGRRPAEPDEARVNGRPGNRPTYSQTASKRSERPTIVVCVILSRFDA